MIFEKINELNEVVAETKKDFRINIDELSILKSIQVDADPNSNQIKSIFKLDDAERLVEKWDERLMVDKLHLLERTHNCKLMKNTVKK